MSDAADDHERSAGLSAVMSASSWRGERPAWWKRTYEEPLIPVVRLEGGELVRATADARSR